jgi:O-antigen/teichoic acid export membrane protein
MYINRKLHKWAGEKTSLNHLFTYRLYLVVLSMLSIPIAYYLHEYLDVGASIDIKMLILFMMMTIYFQTWNQTVIPSLNMLNYRLSFVLFTVLTLVVGLCLSVVLVKWVASTAIYWLTGQLAAQAFIALIAYRYLKKVMQSSLDFASVRNTATLENLKSIFKFSLPLAATAFFMWIQNQSYRMIVENRIGLEYLAFIGLGLGISSSIATAVESVVQQLYLPVFYRQINCCDQGGRAAAFNRMAQMTLPLYLSLTLLVSCLAPFLVDILAHKKFNQAYMFVIFGSWIELFRMTTNLLSLVAQSEMQTRYSVKAYLAGGLLAIGGVYLATFYRYAQLTIPVVLVMSGFTATVIMYVEMKKLMKIKLGIRTIIKSFLVSIPFVFALLFYHQPRYLPVSIIIALIFGGYFAIVQYKINKPFLSEAGFGGVK